MSQHQSGGVGVPIVERADHGLSEAQLLQMYELMVSGRMLDERMWILNRAGQAPFVISCQGHEAAQAGAAITLQPEKDILLPYYRDLVLVLHFGLTPRDLMLSLLAKKDDPNSQGRQMPAHFGSRKHRIITGSSPVATQTLHAAGVALAAKLRGEDTVALTCCGEGGTSQGDFHEAMNFAGIHRLPVIFFVQNNGWAISVPQRKQVAIERISDRAAGYGMPGFTVDGNDPIAVHGVFRQAVERARSGDGPTMIEARVSRITPHSSDDDDRTYRPAEELAQMRASDPITVFRDRLIEQGILSAEQDQALRKRIKADIDEATAYAEAAPYPDPSELTLHVYGS